MPEMSVADYRKILRGIDLREIHLQSLNSRIDRQIFGKTKTVNVKDVVSWKSIEDGFLVENKMTVTARDQRRKIGLKVECLYVLSFVAEFPITDVFFEIYRQNSLPLNVWPFFRETVYSITAKMNIPPLTLPLFKTQSVKMEE